MTDQPMSQWPSEWEYVLPVRPGPEEAVKTLKVLDALARSAREECEVAV